MTKKVDERVAYWEDNYISYWKDRVSSTSENKLVKKDILPPDIKIFRKYYKKALTYLGKDSSRMLDVGIGFGRSVPLYQGYFKNNIWGSDISQGMVDECRRLYPTIADQIVVAPAENQPFKDNSVDLIICWATYDATYQDKTIKEIHRLLHMGGVVLITGKNDNYCKNDKKAFVAEVNARKKGHPNYFTDIKYLEQNIGDFGFEIIKIFKFLRRGDFAKDLFAKNSPEKFYEYVLFLRKTEFKISNKSSHAIASKFSKIFNQQAKKEAL